jgi:hypothetical protein
MPCYNFFITGNDKFQRHYGTENFCIRSKKLNEGASLYGHKI